jgi:hypothetical protein
LRTRSDASRGGEREQGDDERRITRRHRAAPITSGVLIMKPFSELPDTEEYSAERRA